MQETEYIRGSTLIEDIRAQNILHLDTRNVCNPVPGYLPHAFAKSTPGCTSQILPLKLLSAGDSFSLSVP